MAATEESEAGHGQSIPRAHGGIQSEGRGAAQEIRHDARRGGARAGLRRGQPVGLGEEDRRRRAAPDANPFRTAEGLRRPRRENETLSKASALFAGGQLQAFPRRGRSQVRIPQRARLAGVGDARGSEGGAPGLLRLEVAAASARAMRDAELAKLIFRVGDEARNIYGAPKTLMRLRAPGVRARFPLERLHALRSLCRRRNQAHMGGIRAMVHKAQ